MKVEFKASELFTVTAEGTTHAEVFGNVAGLAEVFSANTCGLCRSGNLIPIKRVVDDVAHYEMKCRDCGARLTMGQHKKGGSLYPRRRYHQEHPDVKAGKVQWDRDNPPYLPNGGWEKWVGERNDDSEEAPASKGKKRD
jgi:hypothetical protein